MKRGVVVIGVLALGACATTTPIKCPTLAAYPLLEQQVLHDELPKDGPETQKWIIDYIGLRSACAVGKSG